MNRSPVTPIHGFFSLHCAAFRHQACTYAFCQCTCHHGVAVAAHSEPVAARLSPLSVHGATGSECGTPGSPATPAITVTATATVASAATPEVATPARPTPENAETPALRAGASELRAS